MNSLVQRLSGVVNGRMSNARPHPGPLPQEREDRSLINGSSSVVLDCVRFSKTASKATTALCVHEISEAFRTFTLSPGERVGVRVSV